MLPTFIVIGAVKAGATSMCDPLAAHQDVRAAPRQGG